MLDRTLYICRRGETSWNQRTTRTWVLVIIPNKARVSVMVVIVVPFVTSQRADFPKLVDICGTMQIRDKR